LVVLVLLPVVQMSVAWLEVGLWWVKVKEVEAVMLLVVEAGLQGGQGRRMRS
jgi:hypothetical protein